jgi:hypothetical protein
MPRARNPLSWGKIIAITLATALVTGLVIGALSALFGFDSGLASGGIGGAAGVVGALLISRRRVEQAALRR